MNRMLITKCELIKVFRKHNFLFMLSSILLSCSDIEYEIISFENPSGIGSRFPNLVSTNEGTLLMSWLASPENKQPFSLYFSEFSKGSWSEPVSIFSGSDFFVNWADYPSIFQLIFFNF